MNLTMIVMDKQSHCNDITKVEVLLGAGIGLVSQYWQLVWLLQYVNLYVLGIIYAILWTYFPLKITMNSYKSFSFSKPW